MERYFEAELHALRDRLLADAKALDPGDRRKVLYDNVTELTAPRAR